jgi:hypothetical protein
MSRFSNSNFRSLNESIQNLNTNNRITELEEYVDMLESVLVSIAEQMECDTEELVEMAMTKAREKQLAGKMVTQSTAQMRSYGTSKHPSEYRKSRELQKQYGKEDKSKKTYGINGKVVKEESELDEMAQTKERAKETGAEIDRTRKRADQKWKEWDAHSKDDYQGYYGKEAEFDKERDANWRAQDKQEAERDSKDLYGKGGKIIKKNKDDLIKKRPTYGSKAAKK